jgi:2-polyprenyl-3-methyl-5-hydroxy-6-metoxy-1,4-benzoquinol methylase
MKLSISDYMNIDEWLICQLRDKSVLHFGCAGDHLDEGPQACLHIQLSKVTKLLWGVEIDAAAIEKLEKWLPADGRHKYFCADVQALPIATIGRRFEVVLAGSIIEHLPNPGTMLESARALLETNGQLIIVTPNPFGLMQFLRVALKKYEAGNKQHNCWFSQKTLNQLVSVYGFTPREYYTGYGYRPVSFGWRLQKMLGVPFFRIFPHLGGSLLGVFILP